MKCTKLADLLRNLNMNTPGFALVQLQKHKLFVSNETHVGDVVVFVWVVFVCLVVLYVWRFLYIYREYLLCHKSSASDFVVILLIL